MLKKTLIILVIILTIAFAFGYFRFSYDKKQNKQNQELQDQQEQNKTESKESEKTSEEIIADNKREREEKARIEEGKIANSGADTVSTFPDGSPQDILNEFYSWYQEELDRCVFKLGVECDYDLENGKISRSYTTKDFYENTMGEAKKKAPVIDGQRWLNYNPIFCAQDFGFNLKTKINEETSQKVLIDVDYLSRINFKDFEYKLTVEMTKEDGKWKLNDVFCYFD